MMGSASRGTGLAVRRRARRGSLHESRVESPFRGIPIWATLVGLEYKGEQIAGVVEVPTLGHTYHALRGDGAFRDDTRIRVSDVARLDESMLFYSSLSWFIKANKEKEFMELARR